MPLSLFPALNLERFPPATRQTELEPAASRDELPPARLASQQQDAKPQPEDSSSMAYLAQLGALTDELVAAVTAIPSVRTSYLFTFLLSLPTWVSTQVP